MLKYAKICKMSMKKPLEEILKNLVKNKKILKHSEIITYLQQTQNIKIDQSTLSRKLNKCSIRKVDGFYQLNEVKKVETTGIVFFKSAPNMIVINTTPGHANAIAYQIDLAKKDQNSILGTVAGDDTIFVACDGKTNLDNVVATLKKILGINLPLENQTLNTRIRLL